MTRIRLKVTRQVYGRPLQKPGDEIDLADGEAERLIKLKQAEPVKAGKDKEK